MATKRIRNHFELQEMEDFIRNKEYPNRIDKKDFGSKSNFRRAANKFSIKDSHLLKENKLVIKDRSRQLEIVRDVHQGLGDSEHAKA